MVNAQAICNVRISGLISEARNTPHKDGLCRRQDDASMMSNRAFRAAAEHQACLMISRNWPT
jgi:hypothetical protein